MSGNVSPSDAIADRRVRRTRHALFLALMELMTTTKYDAITVRDIIDRADVGRSTFYAHFANKDELLSSSIDDLGASLIAHSAAEGEPFAFAAGMLRHVATHVSIYENLTADTHGVWVLASMTDVVADVVSHDLRRSRLPHRDDPALARFIAGGFFEMLRGWLESGASAPVAEVAAAFRTMAVRVAGGTPTLR